MAKIRRFVCLLLLPLFLLNPSPNALALRPGIENATPRKVAAEIRAGMEEQWQHPFLTATNTRITRVKLAAQKAQAAGLSIGVTPEEVEALREPMFEPYAADVPWTLDSGKEVTVRVTLIRDTGGPGIPSKGGVRSIRFESNVIGPAVRGIWQAMQKKGLTPRQLQAELERLTFEIARALSKGMSLKISLNDLQGEIGGGKTDIQMVKVDEHGVIMPLAEDPSPEELARLYRSIGRKMAQDNMVGPDVYSLAGDINTGSREVHWMAEGALMFWLETWDHPLWKDVPPGLIEIWSALAQTDAVKGEAPILLSELAKYFAKNKPMPALAAFTGKGTNLGGSEGRSDANGWAARFLAEAIVRYQEPALKEAERPLEGKTLILHGFGAVGEPAARLLAEAGGNILAVSDHPGTYFKKAAGFFTVEDLRKMADYRKEIRRPIGGAHDSQQLRARGVTGIRDLQTDREMLNIDADMLVLGATELAITEENAGDIRAKYIIPIANGAVTPEAADILEANKKILLPDTLVSSGGVIGSRLEMVQNEQGGRWSEEEILAKLKHRLTNALQDTLQVRDELSYALGGRASLLLAADTLSFRRLAEQFLRKPARDSLDSAGLEENRPDPKVRAVFADFFALKPDEPSLPWLARRLKELQTPEQKIQFLRALSWLKTEEPLAEAIEQGFRANGDEAAKTVREVLQLAAKEDSTLYGVSALGKLLVLRPSKGSGIRTDFRISLGIQLARNEKDPASLSLLLGSPPRLAAGQGRAGESPAVQKLMLERKLREERDSAPEPLSDYKVSDAEWLREFHAKNAVLYRDSGRRGFPEALKPDLEWREKFEMGIMELIVLAIMEREQQKERLSLELELQQSELLSERRAEIENRLQAIPAIRGYTEQDGFERYVFWRDELWNRLNSAHDAKDWVGLQDVLERQIRLEYAMAEFLRVSAGFHDIQGFVDQAKLLQKMLISLRQQQQEFWMGRLEEANFSSLWPHTSPAAGAEEAVIVPPVPLDPKPATRYWEEGWAVHPSPTERLRRTAFMAPLGGPLQYLQIAASMKLGDLPPELLQERFEGKLLLDQLPSEGLESGDIYAPSVHPFVQVRIGQLLKEHFRRNRIEVHARVRLAQGDQGIGLKPRNVWKDGAMRFEGFVEAKPEFEGDHPFFVEVLSKGTWYRLRQRGWLRIEPANPAQVEAQAKRGELALGLRDAQDELRYALGYAGEVEARMQSMPDGPEKQEILEAVRALREEGVVTEWVLPNEFRTPLLRRLVAEGKITPALARRAFIASQQAAGIQEGFFVGMQFKMMLSPSGHRVLIMYNPNRASSPKPPQAKPGEKLSHPLSDRLVKVTSGGQMRILPQRSQPSYANHLANPIKGKPNPYGYVFGHVTLAVSQQVAQSEWTEPIDAVVEEMRLQQERLTVTGGNIGAKASASLPDWAHVHDVPWRAPMDDPGDGETQWFRLENGVRTGTLRDPSMTTYALEAEAGNFEELKLQGKRIVALLKQKNLMDYNMWGAVTHGVGLLFITPRNPVEPEPPTSSGQANWKANDDYAKPIADRDYWIAEPADGQYVLVDREEMIVYGLKPVEKHPVTGAPLGSGPFVKKGRPVLDIKMGLMELRRFVLVSQLQQYEDPFLEARLVKAYELVGLPSADFRMNGIIDSLRQANEGLDQTADQEVRDTLRLLDGAQNVDALIGLMEKVSEWRTRHVQAFNLHFSGAERDRFTIGVENLIQRFLREGSGRIQETPVQYLPVRAPREGLEPLAMAALNPTLDREIRIVDKDGVKRLEVSARAGGGPANVAQASAAMGRPTFLSGIFAGETGKLAMELLQKFGVKVLPVSVEEGHPPTRVTLQVVSERKGRRERQLVGEGLPVSLQQAQEARNQIQQAIGDKPYTIGVGERWAGPEAERVAEEMALWITSAQNAGRTGYVIANPSWSHTTWMTFLRAGPKIFSARLSAVANFLGLDPDRIRSRPKEAALRADLLRRQFGIREWLVPLGAAGTVLQTGQGGWHMLPSPLVELTRWAGSTDTGDAAYLLKIAEGEPPDRAAKFGITGSTLFMERYGQVPSVPEMDLNLFRAITNVVPQTRSLEAADAQLLEASVAQRVEALREAKTGNGIAVLPAQLLELHPELAEFLARLPADLAKAVVVWQEGPEPGQARVEANGLTVYRGRMADLAGHLAGRREPVTVLQDQEFARTLAILLSGHGISVTIRAMELPELLKAIGVSASVIPQINVEKLQTDLLQLRSA